MRRTAPACVLRALIRSSSRITLIPPVSVTRHSIPFARTASATTTTARPVFLSLAGPRHMSGTSAPGSGDSLSAQTPAKGGGTQMDTVGTDDKTPEKRSHDAMEEATPLGKEDGQTGHVDKKPRVDDDLAPGFRKRQAVDVCFDIPGGSHIAGVVFGPEDAPPTHRVICIHGWLDNAASFSALAESFDPSLRVVCLDLPGHGKSSHRPHGMPYFFPHYAMSVMQAADSLGWETFSLVGHSMGAGIASICAGGWPDRITRCVCIEGLGPLVYEASRAPEKLAQAYANWSKLVTRGAKVWPSIDDAGRRIQEQRKGLTQESAMALLHRGAIVFADGSLQFRHDQLLRAGSPMYLTKEQVDNYMSNIKCPVLHFRATEGWPFPKGVFDSWTGLITNIRIVEVEGGHHTHMDQPLQITPTLNEFLLN